MTTDANGNYFGVAYAKGLVTMYTTMYSMNMPNYTEFTSLFDQYKILSYTIELRPRFNGRDAAYGAGTVADIPTIYYIYDKDDATAFTTPDQIMQCQKVYSRRLDKPVYITVKYPTIADEIYSSALVTGYAPRKAPFIDCTYDQVAHYGIKFMIQGLPSRAYGELFDIRVKWRFACKNPR